MTRSIELAGNIGTFHPNLQIEAEGETIALFKTLLLARGMHREVTFPLLSYFVRGRSGS